MLDCITNVNDYLKSFGGVLANRIKDEAQPLFNPGDEWDKKMNTLLRKPYQAQGDTIMGLAKTLQMQNSAVVVGEMGTGKTLIGAVVPYIYQNGGRPARTLIMCPGHNVENMIMRS